MTVIHSKLRGRRVAPRALSRRRQQGVVLILALLFALAILILGGSAVRTVVMAEKKGGNLRNQSMSFEAAEAALLAAESHLKMTAFLNHAATPGDYGIGASPLAAGVDGGLAASWSGFDWAATAPANATAVTVTVNGVDKKAYYVIETLVPPVGGGVTEAFRVTAYAQGGSGDATSLLQSTYTR
jgi:type IV pilus assembly protein PilX